MNRKAKDKTQKSPLPDFFSNPKVPEESLLEIFRNAPSQQYPEFPIIPSCAFLFFVACILKPPMFKTSSIESTKPRPSHKTPPAATPSTATPPPPAPQTSHSPAPFPRASRRQAASAPSHSPKYSNPHTAPRPTPP